MVNSNGPQRRATVNGSNGGSDGGKGRDGSDGRDGREGRNSDGSNGSNRSKGIDTAKALTQERHRRSKGVDSGNSGDGSDCGKGRW